MASRRDTNRSAAVSSVALLAFASVALLAARNHPLFDPYEVLNLPAPIWQLGYFDTGRGLLPWLAPMAVAAAIGWRMVRPVGPGARPGRWLLVTLLLCSLIPGRPLGLRSIAALMLTVPWSLFLAGAVLSSSASGFREWAAGLALRVARVPSPIFAAGVTIAAFILSALAADRLFGRVPHVLDATVYAIQAKLFAAGQVGLNVPASLAPYFDHPFLVGSGETRYPMYPPGWPLMLAAGVRLGAGWLVAPALVAGAILLLYLWAREHATESTARTAAALALASPFLLIMGGDTMSHPAALFLFQLSLWLHGRADRGIGWAFAEGAAIGFSGATRPLTAIGLALPLAAGTVMRWSRSPRQQSSRLLAWVAGIAIGLAPILVHNAAVTGSPLVFPVQKHVDGSFRLGFGSGIVGNEHWPEKALANALANFNGLEKYLLEWPLPALAPILLLLLAARPFERAEVLALASVGGLAGAYLVHYYQDLCLGPRYMYEATGVLLFLIAAGLGCARERLAARASRTALDALGALVLGVAGLTICGAVLFLPGVLRTCSTDYWATPAELARAVESTPALETSAVVLVPPELWNAAFPMEPADLAAGPIFLTAPRDLAGLRQVLPSRPFWQTSRESGRVVLRPMP